MTPKIRAHFFVDNTMLAIRRLLEVPRVGDEVRFCSGPKERFFTVTRLCWPMDEDTDEFCGQRVNIGMKPVKEDSE